jgi:VWFA-related protein
LARQTPAPQQPVFQAGTDVVTLDVAVRKDDEPVMGLTMADFEVRDNGVVQTLDYLKTETYPLDLTMVVDQSRFVRAQLDRVKSAIDATAALMTPEDSIRVIAFNTKIREIFDGRPSDVANAIQSLDYIGNPSAYDAIAAALIRPKSSERRAFVVAFTGGQDTSSTVSPPKLMEIAKRADLVLDVFFAYDEGAPTAGRASYEFNQQFHEIRDAARETGGLMDDMLGDDHVTKALKSALLDFKSRYLMAYTLHGVPRTGSHEITVTVKKPGSFTILARKGYIGG